MADQNIEIKVTTVAEGDGAKKTANELGKVDQAAKTGAASAAKTAAANEQAAAKTGRSWKTVGNVMRSLASGDMAGAANAATELGGKFVAIGGAAAAAFASVSMAVKAAVAKAIENAKMLNEIKFGNLDAAAKSLGDRFAEVTGQIDAAKASADALAEASVAVNEAGFSARVAIVNAERNKELAGVDPDDKEAKNRINAKYDAEVADLTAGREKDRLSEGKAARERERKRIQDQLAALNKRDQDYEGTLKSTESMVAEAEDALDAYGGREKYSVGRWLGNIVSFGHVGRKNQMAGENIARLRGYQATALKGLGDNELKRREMRQQLAVLDAQGQADPYRELNVEATRSGARYGAKILEREADSERAKNIEKERAAAQEAAAAAQREAEAREAYDYGRGNLAAARGSVADAEGQYRAAPGVGSAKALQEAKAALKEQEAAFKDLAQALAQASRESSRQAKAAKADLSAD